jgi:[ribosomal protein S5]-alanine N-acetyltransferase
VERGRADGKGEGLIRFIDVRIETPRVLLRPLLPSDAEAIFKLRSNPEMMKYWDTAVFHSLAEAEKMVANSAAGLAGNAMLELGIELRESPGVIGTVCLHTIHWLSERGEIGYSIGPEHQGKGLMIEALTGLLNFVFRDMKFRRLEADIHPANEASRAVLKRLGFKSEGYMFERWNVGGEISDTEFFGLLARDWKS